MTNRMANRRLFIQIVPVSAAGLLAACSDKAAPPAPAPANTAPAPATSPAAGVQTPMPAPAAPAAAPPAAAPVATGPMLDEKDPTAAALGYVAEASRVDKAKHTKFADGQACSNCALYQGVGGAGSGPCPLFAGKQVSAQGWCASYARKPT